MQQVWFRQLAVETRKKTRQGSRRADNRTGRCQIAGCRPRNVQERGQTWGEDRAEFVRLERIISGSPWFGGEEFCAADIEIFRS